MARTKHIYRSTRKPETSSVMRSENASKRSKKAANNSVKLPQLPPDLWSKIASHLPDVNVPPEKPKAVYLTHQFATFGKDVRSSLVPHTHEFHTGPHRTNHASYIKRPEYEDVVNALGFGVSTRNDDLPHFLKVPNDAALNFLHRDVPGRLSRTRRYDAKLVNNKKPYRTVRLLFQDNEAPLYLHRKEYPIILRRRGKTNNLMRVSKSIRDSLAEGKRFHSPPRTKSRRMLPRERADRRMASAAEQEDRRISKETTRRLRDRASAAANDIQGRVVEQDKHFYLSPTHPAFQKYGKDMMRLLQSGGRFGNK